MPKRGGTLTREQVLNLMRTRWPQETIYKRFWKKVDVKSPNECWPWKAGRTKKGYGWFQMGKRAHPAHRIAITFVGKVIPPKMLVCHHCDNPPCCNPNHLYVGTDFDNMRDMVNRGRNKPHRGEDNNLCKLTTEKVLQIRERLKAGETIKTLSQEFSMHYSQIWNIKMRRQWRHI